MTTQELYLKTMFCCMACDGDIAQEEINAVKAIAMEMQMFHELDVENTLNDYVAAINRNGAVFLRKYLNELTTHSLTQDEELKIIELSIKMIEADNRIEYAEVKFFKKIRFRLSVPYEQILLQHPDKEDFLLPDIGIVDDPVWDENVMFTNIYL